MIATYNASGPADFLDVFRKSEDDYERLTVLAGTRVDKGLVDISARTGYSLGGAKPATAHARASEYYQFDWEYAQTPEQSSLIASSWGNNYTYDVASGGFSDDNQMSIDQRGFKIIVQAEAAEFLAPSGTQVLFGATVKAVNHSRKGVQVVLSDGRELSADYALCTFSLGVLQHDDVVFEPELPDYKQEAIHSMVMATYTKIFLQFPRKFWFDTEMAIYADEQRGRYTVWQSLDHLGFLPGSGIIFVTVTGDFALRIEALSNAQVQEEVLSVLRSMFPSVLVPEPTDFYFPRWQANPLFRGSYSNWPPSFASQHMDNMRANIGRLYFAGEATSRKYFGFLQGAYFEGLEMGTTIARCVNGGPCADLERFAEVSFPALHHAAFTHPATDNHAHPILRAASRSRLLFEGVFSEASGQALMQDAIHTLAGRRATKQLAKLYGLNDGTSWEEVKRHRDCIDWEDLCLLCFEKAGIESVLVDDGLGGSGEWVEGYKSLARFIRGDAKRIVRVEVEAEGLLEDILGPYMSPGAHGSFNPCRVVRSFETRLAGILSENARDQDVVGFKSIVCYRTGMDVSLSGNMKEKEDALSELLDMYRRTGRIRLAHKPLNDTVVRIALGVAGDYEIPGDTDIRLTKSSPAHLQEIIEAFPKTTFVILHSAYPYTRDAGYLTAMYSNVYLDFGEVFPFVSAEGQRNVLRQVLELSPTNKIMWSSDGHWWPESYYLGSQQAREALYEVLAESVRRGELTEEEAVEVVQNALYRTAEKVYRLQKREVHVWLSTILTIAVASILANLVSAQDTNLNKVKHAFEEAEMLGARCWNPLNPTVLLEVNYLTAKAGIKSLHAGGNMTMEECCPPSLFNDIGNPGLGPLVIVFTDPDVYSQEDPGITPALHFLSGHHDFNPDSGLLNTPSTAAVAPYGQPRPCVPSSIYRYTFCLFKQPVGFVTQALVNSTSSRNKFNLADFTLKADLGEPIGGVFMLVGPDL
ncbi:hypothetical protein NLJ89_g8342 [Agrocybe chaxingu]|uniref:Amine oxidase domain-containing protein n=1 Tax=Agrocybe chaxingu TaxID=84603 RepID=A0A9W8JVF4_9AGAR|nr:hypothetical protein NLJ89_g8342 [Agrocybe chaxingu]